jgi:hypothetical protein
MLGRSWPLRQLGGGADSWWLTGSAALAAHLRGRFHRPLGDLDVTLSRTPAVVRVIGRTAADEESWAEDLRTWFRAGPTGSSKNQPFIVSRACGLPVDFRSVELPPGVWRSASQPELAMRAGEAIRRSEIGVAYLAPELVLLGKSRQLRPKDHEDFRWIVAQLEPEIRVRLLDLLPTRHPWRSWRGLG